MRQNYLLTLLGAFLLTLISCQKTDLSSESGADLKDATSSSYYDYCDNYCDYGCDNYCEHDCDNHKGCTFTQGYWKNHYEVWDQISGLYLGDVFYTPAELLAILRTPVRGNGLISLAHQLIAAKLNIEFGASDNEIEDAIDDADDLIDDLDIREGDSLPTSATSSLVNELTSFNEGEIGPGHCN